MSVAIEYYKLCHLQIDCNSPFSWSAEIVFWIIELGCRWIFRLVTYRIFSAPPKYRYTYVRNFNWIAHKFENSSALMLLVANFRRVRVAELPVFFDDLHYQEHISRWCDFQYGNSAQKTHFLTTQDIINISSTHDTIIERETDEATMEQPDDMYMLSE